MTTEYQKSQQIYTALKTNRERYRPVWDDVEKYVGITVDPDYLWVNNQSNTSSEMDEFVDDPTSAISVNQFGDYLIGIMWGTGDNAVNLLPSRYVLELTDQALVTPWYDFASQQLLYHMNHSDAGLHTSLQPYAYDQSAFGTSGIGAFPNQAFGIDDNAIVFRPYGIDNTCIDEGKGGIPDTTSATYHWRVSRIVGEFCKKDGEIDKGLVLKLPKAIQEAYKQNDLNQEFNIVNLITPREDYNPKLKGKRGTRYKGVWFSEAGDDQKFFKTEDFAERPICMARMIKVRGQVYGRSAGTLLMSSIRSVNFMMATTIEILEKIANPSLGMFNNAIFGDNVLDTSPNGLTIFNSSLAAASGNPVFPLQDVGDPRGIIEFLIPYLNDKITTAFKVDALLDFNSAKDMTATESLQRYAIRGKSLAALLQQQKIELLEPLTKRCVSILLKFGELGVNPNTDTARAKALEQRGKLERIIPQPVLDVMAAGKPWYSLKYNNELEKLTRTEAVQNAVQILQATTAMAALYPEIVGAVDWYTFLKDINDNLDANNKILYSADEFKAKIAQAAKLKQAEMAIAAGQAGAQMQKDTSQAQKNTTEAQNAKGQI